jgi:hypothetical protein
MVRRAARLVTAAIGTILVLGGCASSPGAVTPAPAAPQPSLASTADPPAPSAAPAPPTPDLRPLVIAAQDIPLPGFGPPDVGPLDENAVDGLTAFFTSTDGDRQLGETIVLLPDADAARTALRGASTRTTQQRPGAESVPASVGDGGVLVTGYQRDGTASTLLLFTQGRASVVMDFRGPATDPVPPQVALEAGVRQAALLRPQFA